jgi:hypothetical protein
LIPQIDAQLAVRQTESIERTKAPKTIAFGGPREDKDADEDVPAQEEEGEGTFVSSIADEPPRKRSKTAPAIVDVMDKVSHLSVFSHLTPT